MRVHRAPPFHQYCKMYGARLLFFFLHHFVFFVFFNFFLLFCDIFVSFFILMSILVQVDSKTHVNRFAASFYTILYHFILTYAQRVYFCCCCYSFHNCLDKIKGEKSICMVYMFYVGLDCGFNSVLTLLYIWWWTSEWGNSPIRLHIFVRHENRAQRTTARNGWIYENRTFANIYWIFDVIDPTPTRQYSIHLIHSIPFVWHTFLIPFI